MNLLHVNARPRERDLLAENVANSRGTSIAPAARMRFSLLLSAALLGACAPGRPAQSTDEPYESFDEDNYGNVPTHGPGQESAGAYYGSGSSVSEPERTPASPTVGEPERR